MQNRIVNLTRKDKLRIAGIMSGTSLDGVDVAVVDVSDQAIKVKAFNTIRYPAGLRKKLFDVCVGATICAGDIAELNVILGEVYADSVVRTANNANIPLKSIDLIGSHGQTIYHDPKGKLFKGKRIGCTMQIGEASVIAQRTSITTVCDFRPADIAVGGQGAPLVPYADYFLFGRDKVCRAIQNIGGIGNVTYLPANGKVKDVIAFDTGPGNMVIDELVGRISGRKKRFDCNGIIASKGVVHKGMLKELMKDKYFSKQPPKSTGRELYGNEYVDRLVAIGSRIGVGEGDMVATATAVTAESIAMAYRQYLPSMPKEMIVCGGGAHNKTLVRMLQQILDQINIMPMDQFGIDCDSKEAVSFAILAYATVKGIASNVCSATGANKSVILGKIVQV